MRQLSTTVFLGMLALTITGCPSSNNQQSINPTSSPTTTPVAVQTPPPVKPPLVAQNPSGAAYLAPGLIQPTNANQRTKQVAKGNRDPFAALFLPVPVPPISAGHNSNTNSSAAAPAQAPQTPGSSSKVNVGQSRSPVAVNNSRSGSNQSGSSNRTAISNPNIPAPPGALPNNNLQPAPPPALPEPDLAKSVIVMGVIQIGEQTQAIVQVPSEATSRYVQVGQSLSNGQVLVKRIELNAGAEPLVILEQFGVEVSKAIGEPNPSQAQPTTPTAAVPYLPPQNANSPTAELPAPPPQNINSPTAEFPASLRNVSSPTAELPASLRNVTPTAESPIPPQNSNAPGVNNMLPQLPSSDPVSTK